MIEDRFVITDGLWTRLEPCLPGEVSDSGGYELARHGATFQQALATRILSFVVFADGKRGVFLRVFSKR